MRIAVISDIHDNLINLEKCLSWCKQNFISRLICCGDVTNSETLKFMAKKFSGQIYLVDSNIELYNKKEVELYKNINSLGEFGVINIDRKVLGICHEPFLIKKIKEKSECNVIFYGHTHKPWIKEENSVKIVNPGTLGGVFSKATFAVWNSDDDNLELKILELL